MKMQFERHVDMFFLPNKKRNQQIGICEGDKEYNEKSIIRRCPYCDLLTVGML